MFEIRDELKPEYERWSRLAGNGGSTGSIIDVQDVLRAHFLLIDYFFQEGLPVGGVGPRNLDLLHSAVSRQSVAFGGSMKWRDDFDLCATLFFGLIKNHPFHDANKRTALLIALYYLRKTGRTPDAPQKDFENLTLRIASNGLDEYPAFKRFSKLDDGEVLFISNFLRRNTRAVDKHNYVITYQQLDTILSRYGFHLSNPDGNYIDVVRDVEVNTGILFRRKKVVTERVTNIGFPGWKTEVNLSTIKKVRKATKLSTQDGVDSKAFFQGADSMEALISAYKNPLERLANK